MKFCECVIKHGRSLVGYYSGSREFVAKMISENIDDQNRKLTITVRPAKFKHGVVVTPETKVTNFSYKNAK